MRGSTAQFHEQLSASLSQIDADGLYKREREIVSKQGAEITVSSAKGERQVLNFCANNYLGLADNAGLIEAAHQGLERYGLGMASVRFICGTEDQHRKLEREIAAFLGFDDSILYAACFDANGGVFEPLFEAEDAIISDALNHASLIDGIRLCKAERYRYANNDMADLEVKLQQAADARRRVIVTDGVFSMDGTIAQLDKICDLADRYDALVLVDDCHGMGVLGEGGRGVLEHCQVMGRVDIVTGTLGKALGGSMGGFVAAAQPVVEMLRQRSRPYLFSNALAPAIVAAGRRAIQMVAEGTTLRTRLWDNAKRFRTGMEQAGFRLLPGAHPIVPVMIGDAALAQQLAEALLEEGIYVIGFFYPVVPKGQARVRTQLSAAHSPEQIDRAVDAFTRAGRALSII